MWKRPSPVVELNRAAAVAMAEGPSEGLELIASEIYASAAVLEALCVTVDSAGSAAQDDSVGEDQSAEQATTR